MTGVQTCALPISQGAPGQGAVAIREKTPDQGSVTIDLVMIGDILQHTGVYRSGQQPDGSYNFDHVFSHIGPTLEGVDVKVLNQETPLGGAELGFTGYPSFNGPQGDMRGVLTFTIDPRDAKDFDDALSFRVLEDGNFEVGVHIADVSHYVQPGTILDDEAYQRATSVYLVDRVVPMLPEVLSNFACSLRLNQIGRASCRERV